MIDEFSEFIVAGAIGLLGWFFGGMDGFVKVLVTFAIIDYVTGVCAAGAEGKISSSAGFNGIARKVVMFLLVGVSHIIDQHILGHFGHTDAMRTAVCLFYICNEGISIIENADRLKVPIPGFLRGKFLNFAKKCLEDGDTTALLEKNGVEHEKYEERKQETENAEPDKN